MGLNRQIIICTVVTSFLVFGSACNRTAAPPNTSAIDRLLRAPVDSGALPGVVAAAASRESVLYQGVFGKKDLDSGVPMAVDSIFRIASMTKAVTSVAVMQLVEQGKIGLDDAAFVHVPELQNVKVLEGFDAAGKPIYHKPAHAPTVRELLSHTAGYAYSFWNENMKRYEGGAGLPDGREHMTQLPLAFDPASRWGYGPNTDILGIMVENVSGLTLEEYFRQHIFDPLRMPDSSFQGTAAGWARVASTYQRVSGDRLGPAVIPLSQTPPQVKFFSGGGGLMSTAPDYIRFLRALLNGGQLDGMRILQPESISLMAQNQIGDLEVGPIATLSPDLLRDVDFFPESKDKFGLGFLINTDPVQGGRAAGSLAWAGLFNTYFWVDRENDICGVLMSQILPFGDPVVLTLLEDYERAVYATFRGDRR